MDHLISLVTETVLTRKYCFSTAQLTGGHQSTLSLTFRHRASCILGQAFRYSPQNAFYIFNQQIYFII